jgi:uncharacterized protein involved in exopolysaccharide biosynthesis
MTRESSHQVNLLDFIAFAIRWRKFLLITVFTVALIVAAISFTLPSKYRSSGVVQASESSSQSIGSLISSKLASLGGISGFAPGMGEVSGQLFIVMLKGRELSERVIDQFDLREVYETGDEPIEEVLEVLKGYTHFELDLQANTINIDVEDTSPERARDMTAYYIEQLDLLNQDINSRRAEKEREFIGRRLGEARTSLTMYEDSMSAFQMRTGVLDIEEQIKATVQAAAKIEAQRLMTKAELELNVQIFDPGSPEIELLRMKLAGIDSSLATIIRKRGLDESPDFLINLLDSPEHGKQFLRLMREIEIQQLVVLYLTQQYEQQKIESVRNTPTLSIVQQPVIATKRIWPRRGLMVLLAAFGAFALALLIGMMIEFVRSATNDPAHPQHQRMSKIRQSWSG